MGEVPPRSVVSDATTVPFEARWVRQAVVKGSASSGAAASSSAAAAPGGAEDPIDDGIVEV